MPSVEIVAVGTELLLGQLVDTNTPLIAQTLASAGIDVRATQAIGDNRQRIAAAIRASLMRAEGIVTTGGLGPTTDDLTKEGVCDALGLGVELYEPALRQMERSFAKLGRPMRDNNRKQAELPKGSRPLDNPNGTAPGFIAFSDDGRFVACMPGVLREMKPMLSHQLLPFLRERFDVDRMIRTRVVHTIGMGESEIDHRIGDLFRSSENPKIAVLAHDFRVDVKIMARAASPDAAEQMIAPLQAEIERRLQGGVFGTDDDTPAGAILVALRLRNRRLAIAESFTGGRLAAALTSVAGASASFAGAVVAYEDAVKVAQLGVRQETIERYGAVSEETAREMASGIRERFGTALALATTGIAGPGGGSKEKPVGLVWLALSDQERGERAWQFQLEGDRESVQQRATTVALNLLWRHLEEVAP
jgi:nicotinamide-nucleotide amidase